MLPVELAQPGEALFVEELVVAAQHPVAELLPQLGAAFGVVARHLPQVQGRLGEGGLLILAGLVGDAGHTVAEALVAQELGDLFGVDGQRLRLARQRGDVLHDSLAAGPEELLEPVHRLRSSRTSSKPSCMQCSKTLMSVMASGSKLNPTQHLPL